MSDTTPLIGLPNFDKLEIIKEGTATTPSATATSGSAGWATDNQHTTYAHNLGFIPIVHAVINISGLYLTLPNGTNNANTGLINFLCVTNYIVADTTNFYFYKNVSINTSAAASLSIPAYNVRYWLMRKVAS